MWLAGDDWLSENFVEDNVKFLQTDPEYVASSGRAFYREGDPDNTRADIAIDGNTGLMQCYVTPWPAPEPGVDPS